MELWLQYIPYGQKDIKKMFWRKKKLGDFAYETRSSLCCV